MGYEFFFGFLLVKREDSIVPDDVEFLFDRHAIKRGSYTQESVIIGR